MAAVTRENFDDLMADLRRNGPNYSMFYAIYLCDKMMEQLYPDERRRRPLGQKGLTFQPYPHYVYGATNIREVRYDGEKPEVTFVLNMMGLYGIDSPLPRCYHDQVAAQQNIHGPDKVPLQNFFDIFNNRFYWLYYQAWKKYRYYLQVDDRPDNTMMNRVFAFIGQGPAFRTQETGISPYKLLQLSGIFCNKRRSKSGLLITLREFFPRLEIAIEEFIPTMVKVDNPPVLGKNGNKPRLQLGTSGLVGKRVLDLMSRVKITLGPMGFDDYTALLPGGKNAVLLNQLLQIYLNDGLQYDVCLRLKAEALRGISWRDKRAKLGRSLWLGKPQKDVVVKEFRYEAYTGQLH